MNSSGKKKNWNVTNYQYLKEKKRLGTAGSLSLLPKHLKEPLIVMNGDILTKFNINQLLNFHKKNHSFATICAREYEFKIPFGVIHSNGIELNEIITQKWGNKKNQLMSKFKI